MLSLDNNIEFNGTYWHSDDYSKFKDHLKVVKCKEKGIDLLVIEEQDWIEDKELCIRKIKEHVKEIKYVKI